MHMSKIPHSIIMIVMFLIGLAISLLLVSGCNDGVPKSSSGVSKATVKIDVGSDGLTSEQRNIKERLETDNKPGSIKHLYVISAYSGQVIIYSTVKGKVTSGGKRLTPNSITDVYDASNGTGFKIKIAGLSAYTQEVLQDDGTYGSSMDYLYWTDQNGVYHQHYVTGGQILHISSAPISVKSVIINMEVTTSSEDE